jgi:polysaccharide export outer membrane protein
MGPAAPVPVAPAPAAVAAEPVEVASLPAPVLENQTFVTLDDVPRYKIGSGDILDILLTTGFAQEKLTVAVKANGRVTVDFHEVKVAGLTAEQAGEAIRQLLAPFYKQISVEVLVKEYHSKKVVLMGAINGKAGTFPLKGRTTLLELLAQAGGPSPEANLERVRVLRPNGSASSFNLFRFLSDETLGRDLILDAGEVVFLPTRGPAEERKVFVLGEVRTPGAFSFVPNMRLSQALALAGGPTEVGVLESARLIRANPGQSQLLAVDFRKVLEQGDRSQDILLHANDLIVVPRGRIGNWNAFLAKIRPTLETLTFPLALPVQIRVLTR